MTGKGGKLTAVSLTQLSTSLTSLNQTSIFRGIITNLHQYDSKTKVLCFRLVGIEEDKGTIEIEVRGEVGDEMNRKLKEGKQIILKGKGGKLVLPGNDKERSKVVYEKMISGYFLPGEVSFEISQDLLKKAKRAKEAVVDSDKIPSNAKSTLSAPPTTATENKKDENASHRVKMSDKSVQTRSGRFIPDSSPELVDSTIAPMSKKRTAETLDGDGDQEMEDRTRDTLEIKAKKVSAPGEGSRSKKRRKQEEKLNWDLKLADNTSYTPLKDVQSGIAKGSKNSMVVIVGVTKFPPRETSGDQWFVRLLVTDPTLSTGGIAQNDSMLTIEMQWYENDEKRIPRFEEKDILIARSVFVPSGRIKIVRSSKFANPYRLLKPSELLDPAISPFLVSMPFKDSPTIVLSEAELNFAVQLAKFYLKRNTKISQNEGERAFEPTQTQTQGASFSNANTHPPLAAASSSTATIAPRQPGRLREIKDIEPGVFCDVYGEILKCHVEDFQLPSLHPVNLYITDYTTNPLLMSYEKDSTSSLPAGQQVLQISLFENQSEPLKPLMERSNNGWMEVKVGDFVRVDNLRPKVNENGLLEGTLVDDTKYKEKRYLRVIRKDGYLPKEVQELLKRKREQMKQNRESDIASS